MIAWTKIFNFTRLSLNLRLVNRSYTKQMDNLAKIFVTHLPDEDVMKISFVYGTSALPEREFNFLRCKDEKLESALVRMKSKIEGAMIQRLQRKKKKRDDSHDSTSLNAQNSDIEINVIRNGEKLDGNIKNVEAWTQGAQLQVGDLVFEVCENAPLVSHLSLPKNIMVGFLAYPKICLEFSSKDDSIFTWYRRITKDEKTFYESNNHTIMNKKGEFWLKLSEGFFYVATDKDIGHRIKLVCLPKCGDKTGKPEEVISATDVTAGPVKCPFEKRHEYTRSLTESGSYRCISYNILADLYADSDTARNELFPYCPAEALAFDYRKQLFLKEILGYNGDILCLQEVDRKLFQCDLLPVLSSVKLEGVYNEKGGQVAEGLACFYRSTKFRFFYSASIVLSEAVQSEPVLQNIFSKISENEALKERILSRTTALQIVGLECLDAPKRKILIGNTHLYFHPESDNIRLIQAAMCVQYLEHIYQKIQEKDPSYSTAVILSGDFNSCPEFGVFQYMTQGAVPENIEAWKSNPEEEVDGIQLQHSLKLDSACGTPAYTNYTQGFVGCLDYIFYDKEKFTVTDVVPLPSHEDVTEYIALPNRVFPSDHLALICTLKWK